MIAIDSIDMREDRSVVRALVAEVVDAVEAELDMLVASVEDRVIALMQATNGDSPAALHDALHRGVSAVVREALARLRSQVGLSQELPPDLIELARVCAGSRCGPAGLADAWLVGQEEFWDRFQVVAERTLADPALCWEVIKAARARLRGRPAGLSALFRSACERELALIIGIDEDSRLPAVLRALDGQLRRRDRKTIERQLRSAEQLIHHPVTERSDALLIALRVAEIMEHERSGARSGRRALSSSPDGTGWIGHNRTLDGRARLSGVLDLRAPRGRADRTRIDPRLSSPVEN